MVAGVNIGSGFVGCVDFFYLCTISWMLYVLLIMTNI
jgi:hypothetical protein